MKYELKRVSPEVPRRLVEKYRCDLLSATILSRRGITHRNDLRFYLENSLNCLHSPFLFEDMDAAVTRYRTGTTSNGIIPVTWEETWEQACLN